MEPRNRWGAGTVVCAEVRHLWLPKALAKLAKQPLSSRGVRSHEELQRVLKLRNEDDIWYALTVRSHQFNGGFADISMIRRPCRDLQQFLELQAVLATAAGNPPGTLAVDFSTASVCVFPNELLRREPREVVAELLGQGNSQDAE